MSKKPTKEKTHSVDIAVLLVFAACGLILPAVIILKHFVGIDLLPMLRFGLVGTVFGVIFTVLATLVCFWNFYVSIFVPWSYRREHGGMEGFAHTSGLPLIGVVFVLLAGALMPVSTVVGIVLLFLYIIDGNGMPWLFICLVREKI